MCLYSSLLRTCVFTLLFFIHPLHAAVYPLTPSTDVVGETKLVITKFEDSFITLAEKYDVGFEELIQANPKVDPWIPGDGVLVVIPSRHILPSRPQRQGIVINLAEYRLYYFPKGGNKVYTYPLGIGREQWRTPLGKLTVINKKEKPTWNVPPSIQQEAREAGKPVKTIVLPGPDNPLGEHAMRLSNPSYLIHGTNKPAGIGRRVSHGCINMYPADVLELYGITAVGTTVNIVHDPYKVGWKDGYLWLETHQQLEDYKHRGNYSLEALMKIVNAANQEQRAEVDWSLVKQIHHHSVGVPMPIARK